MHPALFRLSSWVRLAQKTFLLGSFGKKDFFTKPRHSELASRFGDNSSMRPAGWEYSVGKERRNANPRTLLQRGRPAPRLLCTMKSRGGRRFRGKLFKCIKKTSRNRVNRSLAPRWGFRRSRTII